MKSLIVFLMSLLFVSPAFAKHCKAGDLNDCAMALLKLHKAKIPPQKFASSFDDICAENAKFKCIKKTVRGDTDEEMKFTGSEHPKAHLYQIRLAGENYIYILEAK